MKRFLTAALIALSLVPLAPGHALAASPAALASARRAIRQGFDAADPAQLMKARGQLAALSAAEPRSASLHVWVAYADWRAVPILMRTDRAQVEKIDLDGIDHCDQALRLDAKQADALALRGSLQGLLISFQPGSVMTLGPESEASLARALELEPNNPRAKLLQAVGTYNKPAAFGGGPARAVAALARARELFGATAPADSAAFDWGRDDVWIWSGRAALAAGDYAAARSMFEKALEIDPGSGWVRSKLLPAADSALARSSAADSLRAAQKSQP
jgi:tetratricopeptide (TPR) repeat protein